MCNLSGWSCLIAAFALGLSTMSLPLSLHIPPDFPLNQILPVTELDNSPLPTPSPFPLLLDLSISISTSQFLVLPWREADSDICFTGSESHDPDAGAGFAERANCCGEGCCRVPQSLGARSDRVEEEVWEEEVVTYIAGQLPVVEVTLEDD